MATKKITKKDYFMALGTLLRSGDDNAPITEEINIGMMKEFIAKELERLTVKKGASPAQMEADNANRAIKNDILNFMEGSEGEEVGSYTVSDIIAGLDYESPLSNQKVSALLKQMVEEGLIERIEDKRKAFFRIVAED